MDHDALPFALSNITDDDLAMLVDHWQGRLRLQDWRINATLVRHFRLSVPGRLAEIGINPEYRRAEIYVLHPADVPPDTVFGPDPERSIVHELAHIVLHPLSRYDVPHLQLAEEQAVIAFSDALIALHRHRPDLLGGTNP